MTPADPEGASREPRARGLGRAAGIAGDGGSITGTHEQIAERLLAYRDAGVDHVQVVTSPGGPAGAEGMARVLAQLATAGAR